MIYIKSWISGHEWFCCDGMSADECICHGYLGMSGSAATGCLQMNVFVKYHVLMNWRWRCLELIVNQSGVPYYSGLSIW